MHASNDSACQQKTATQETATQEKAPPVATVQGIDLDFVKNRPTQVSAQIFSAGDMIDHASNGRSTYAGCTAQFDAMDLELGTPKLHVELHGSFIALPTLDRAIGTLVSARNYFAHHQGQDAALYVVRPPETPEEAPPPYHEVYFGMVGCNSVGNAGVIIGFKRLAWGWSYVGYNVADGSEWAASNPLLLAANLGEFIDNKVRIAYDQGRRGSELTLA